MLDNKLIFFSYKRLAVCYDSRRGEKLSNDLESEEGEVGVGIHSEESLGEHEDAATGYMAVRMSGLSHFQARAAENKDNDPWS